MAVRDQRDALMLKTKLYGRGAIVIRNRFFPGLIALLLNIRHVCGIELQF